MGARSVACDAAAGGVPARLVPERPTSAAWRGSARRDRTLEDE